MPYPREAIGRLPEGGRMRAVSVREGAKTHALRAETLLSQEEMV